MEIKENQSIYLTITQVSEEISTIGLPKAQKNSIQNYMYRGIDPLLNLISSICSKYGLIILSRVMEYQNEECGATKSGTIQRKVLMHIEYKIKHIHNEQECVVTQWGEAIDTSDKATNKATSVAYKYMAIFLFKIPIVGIDNDVDNFNPETTKAKTPIVEQSATTPLQPPIKIEPTQEDINSINITKSMIDHCNDLASCNDMLENGILKKWASWNEYDLAFYLKRQAEKLNGIYSKDKKQYIEKV